MDGMYYFHPENAPATHARNMPRWPRRAIDNTLAQLAPPRIRGRWVRSRRAGSPRATASCLPARVLSAQSAIAVPGRRQPPTTILPNGQRQPGATEKKIPSILLLLLLLLERRASSRLSKQALQK